MPLIDLDAVEARSNRVATLEGSDDRLYYNALYLSAEDVPDLAAENRALRLLLAQSKPFIAHNGLLLRLGALGIKADPAYKQIAADHRAALADKSLADLELSRLALIQKDASND
jgi:hypothetical protein